MKNTLVLLIFGCMGDHFLKTSGNIGCWKGADVEVIKDTFQVYTLCEGLDKTSRMPVHLVSAPLYTGEVLVVEVHHTC